MQTMKMIREKLQSPLKMAVLEFAAVFLAEIGWSLVRKTSQNIIDSFAIAVLTAVLLYGYHSTGRAKGNSLR